MKVALEMMNWMVQSPGQLSNAPFMVMFEVAPVELEFSEGWMWQLPKGPFALAAAGGAPIYPVFVMRNGYRSYRVEVGGAIEVRRARGEEREAAMLESAREWAGVLGELVRREWAQWFVFESRFVCGEEGGRG